MSEQCLELETQGVIPRTSLVEVGGPPALLDLERGVKDPVDLPPAFGLHRVLAAQVAQKPSLCQFPVPHHRIGGDPQNLSGLLYAQTAEKPKLHHLALAPVERREPVEGFIDRQQIA